MKLLVINGPNINLLGMREPSIYGENTYTNLCDSLDQLAGEYALNIDETQSNHEGEIVDIIQEAMGAYDGIVINPAGYTHTSVAILDALLAVGIPYVEVHISKVSEREAFRQQSFVRAHALTTIEGKGIAGYREAILYLRDYLIEQKKQ